MLLTFKRILRNLMMLTPFEIHRRLPATTLDPMDLLLAAYEIRGEQITILQVGACDGANRDPIHHYVIRGFTNAILIEPNPLAYARLEKTYAGIPNVTLIQAAIGERDGTANFYRVKNTEQMAAQVDWNLLFASFYREHLEHHGFKPDQIEQITVPCRSLKSLFVELDLKKIDLLQVDTEGFDATVVRMALNLPKRPDCINFEHVHLRTVDRQPLFDLLEANGYLLSHDTWNILAIQKLLLEDLKKGRTSASSQTLESRSGGARRLTY